MEKINFNKDWRFTLEDNLDYFTDFGFWKYSEATGAASRFHEHSNWEKVNLPHDFVISLPKSLSANTIAGGFCNSNHGRLFTDRKNTLDKVYNVGWYRKEFHIGEEYSAKRIFVEFEGVFRDSIVWVNGVYIDRNASGYMGFEYDITDHIVFGEINSIAVRVDCDQPEGWWYEGGGIYRNVWLKIKEPIYVKSNSVRIISDTTGRTDIEGIIVNDTESERRITVNYVITDNDGAMVEESTSETCIPAFSEVLVHTVMNVEAPKLWSVDTPTLYNLLIDIGDVYKERFGYRSIELNADRGFLLNGKPLKLRGACVHQDLGGVGVALTDELQAYKIKKLKEMGVNAYRCSHNAPSPALLDACDELGMLVMDETRSFGTAPEAMRQLTSLVLRDRNRPSVFIWCIGNEEFSIDKTKWSCRLMEKAKRVVKSLDPTRLVTYAGANGEDFDGANSIADVRGINYIRNGNGGYWVDKYHAEHRTQPIIGTEQTSYVLSRGAEKCDFGSGILDCFGNVTMEWGSTPKGFAKFFEEREYLAGGFMWTGFDYRGEPNPFVFTGLVSSFGTIDLAGMEKPPFYYYKSLWRDEPTLKILPHWNYNDGETATVGIYTNCERVELILNGKTVNVYYPKPFDNILVSLPFEKGRLVAKGKKGDIELVDVLESSEGVESLATRVELDSGEDGISIVEITALDKEGRFCPLADDDLEITVDGGELVGVCNGDPRNMRDEQPKALEYTEYVTTFTRDNGALYPVPERSPNTLKRREDTLVYEASTEGHEDDYRLVAKFKFDKGTVKNTYTSKISGVGGYEYIEFERFATTAHVYLNGEEIGNNVTPSRYDFNCFSRPYRFYCNIPDGINTLTVVTEGNGRGADSDFSGYVKIGKTVKSSVRMRLHYGKLRVFLRSKAPSESVRASFV